MRICVLGKTYPALTPRQALSFALVDKECNYTPAEKRALESILSNPDNYGVPSENGRDFHPPFPQTIVIHVEATEDGYSVGRWF